MFCPACGAEERTRSQFCRGCGVDMRTVRTALEEPDSISASAAGARDEIGRAIAAKIAETRTTRELTKVVEEVLPQIEKFLESPEERRLRRIRGGVLLCLIGLGISLFLGLFGLVAGENLPWPAGLVPCFLGLAILINGVWFSVPRKHRLYERDASSQAAALLNSSSSSVVTDEIAQPSRPTSNPPSVTENTTKHLSDTRQGQ